MEYYLEVKGECIHCSGSACCYPCDGTGHDEDGECGECGGDGVCAECVDGKEHWLMYRAETTQNGAVVRPAVNGKRGSMLRHNEAVKFLLTQAIPDWYAPYHGLA